VGFLQFIDFKFLFSKVTPSVSYILLNTEIFLDVPKAKEIILDDDDQIAPPTDALVDSPCELEGDTPPSSLPEVAVDSQSASSHAEDRPSPRPQDVRPPLVEVPLLDSIIPEGAAACAASAVASAPPSAPLAGAPGSAVNSEGGEDSALDEPTPDSSDADFGVPSRTRMRRQNKRRAASGSSEDDLDDDEEDNELFDDASALSSPRPKRSGARRRERGRVAAAGARRGLARRDAKQVAANAKKASVKTAAERDTSLAAMQSASLSLSPCCAVSRRTERCASP